MDITLIQDYVTALLLHFVRVATFLSVLPLFGKQRQ